MTFSRWLLGLLFTAGGVALMILVPAIGGEGAVALSIMSSLVWIVAFTAFGPLLVPAIGALLGIVHGRTTLGYLARANVRDAVRRSASTAAPVMVLMAFVAATAGTLETTAEAAKEEANRVLVADAVVASDHPIRTELAGTRGVRALSEEAPVPVEVAPSEPDDPAETFDGMAVDPEAYLRTHRITPVAGDLRNLKGASVAVNPVDRTWRVGDTMIARVGGGDRVSLRVVALLPPSLIGPSMLLPPEFMPSAGPRVYTLQTDGTRVGIGVSKPEWIEQLQREQERTNLRVMLALLGLASLYTIVAIVNAVVVSAADRVEEFRTHRVTGLTRGQVVGMALWEALTLAAAGLVIGGLAALSTLIGNAAAIADMLGFPVFVVPMPVIVGVAVAVTAVVASTSVLTTLSATRAPREGAPT